MGRADTGTVTIDGVGTSILQIGETVGRGGGGVTVASSIAIWPVIGP